MLSSLLTLGIRTPEFLDKDKYFPNNYLFEKPENFQILKKEVENLISKTDNGDSLLMMSKTLNGANEEVGAYRNIVNDKVKAWRFVNIKIGKEINVNVNSNDISSFFKMASSINLRRLAIENGVKDVSESHS